MFDFLSQPFEQLSNSQFVFLLIVWVVFASGVMTFMDQIVGFICKLIRGKRKHDLKRNSSGSV